VFSFLRIELPGTAEFVLQFLNRILRGVEENYSSPRRPALEIASYAQRPPDKLLINFGCPFRPYLLGKPSFHLSGLRISQKDQKRVVPQFLNPSIPQSLNPSIPQSLFTTDGHGYTPMDMY
jgi:hypothetical protein